MAGKTAIPNELTKILEIKTEDKSAVLRRFLVELANKVDKLEERIEKLEASSAP